MEAICEYLLMIPEGRVVTYKQVAEYLGNPGLARVVGNLLHVNPDPDHYPCFRVVNAKGRLAANFGFGGALAQKRRLELDGIEVDEVIKLGTNGEVDVEYYVDLSKYRWELDC